jgi:hypothetical protein
MWETNSCTECYYDQFSGNMNWAKQCQSLNVSCPNFRNIPKVEKKQPKLVWITIQDFKRRITDLDKLIHFMKKIEYIFDECHWCIEAGKIAPPDSNLHIHMLARYHNSKKGKNQLCIEWSKLFDTDLRDSDFFCLKQHRDVAKMPSYQDWIAEKLEYFVDESKGCHQNALDLGARGAWGVSTSL